MKRHYRRISKNNQIFSVMFTQKDDILSLFSFVLDKLQSEKYAALNAANNVEGLGIKKQVNDVAKRLKATSDDYLTIDGIYAPRNIRRHWAIFDMNFDGNINDGTKISYRKLLDEFVSLLGQFKDYSAEQYQKSDTPTKIIYINELDDKINSLQKARERLRIDIEKRNLSPQKDNEIIETLKSQLEKLDAEYLAAVEAKRKLTSDNMAEQNISDKVSKAFDGLQEYTNVIEEERKRLKVEYNIALWCIPVLILFFVALYGFFIHDLTSNRNSFAKWIDFVPYTFSIPVFVALIWLCVYLKDRASKISIELSTRLFNIHYLEGLMKLTNSLSITPEESVRKIDHATALLMDNYLSQNRDNYITEKDISKMELSELKSNPYWKILQELKSLIKLIKQ